MRRRNIGTERFRHEHELLNGQSAPDGIHTYQAIEVPERISVIWLKSEEVPSVLEGGTGILCLGFPECPWCRTPLPVLFDAMREARFDGNFYYI
ncbi:MAG: hypothetical protein ACOYI8_03925 [Christensenellales bacterium]|jgi:hypothetical protein